MFLGEVRGLRRVCWFGLTLLDSLGEYFYLVRGHLQFRLDLYPHSVLMRSSSAGLSATHDQPYGDGELEEFLCTLLDAILSLQESRECLELRWRF